jgi:hypothetical protein
VHLKSDRRLEIKFLKGKAAERINALMSAIGYKFCKTLRALACFVSLFVRWVRYIANVHFLRLENIL